MSLVYPVTTTTEFFDVIKSRVGRRFVAPKVFTQSAYQVANAIVKCAENPRPEVLPFPLARVLILMNASIPGVLDFFLRTYYKSKSMINR